MVLGDGRTGKTTLTRRLNRRQLRIGRPSQVNHHGISIKQWSYAPSTSSDTINFMTWDFNDQVTPMNGLLIIT